MPLTEDQEDREYELRTVQRETSIRKLESDLRYEGKLQAQASGRGSGSFLKKRTKKLLRVGARSIRECRSQNDQKFFASFFQKRSASLPPCLPCAVAPPPPLPSPRAGEGDPGQLQEIHRASAKAIGHTSPSTELRHWIAADAARWNASSGLSTTRDARHVQALANPRRCVAIWPAVGRAASPQSTV